MDKEALRKAVEAHDDARLVPHLTDEEDMERAITAYLEAVDGVIVPREPTEAMVLAGAKLWNLPDPDRADLRNIAEEYRLMITAAQEEGEGHE